jgi:uncharacterized protein
MRGLFLLLFLLFNFVSANDLYKATSPYLLQHKDNPVNWHEYNEATLVKAKSQNKLIFLSIGYATCHWCHVMASESFENEKIAALLNRDFISIKVDREEMSHLDTKYQRLHMLLRKRSGGWPLSAFLTPDAKPFYIATYIPDHAKYDMQGLDTMLLSMVKKFHQHPNKIESRANHITKIETTLNSGKIPEVAIKLDILPKLLEAYNEQYDTIYHGFSKQPKFPESSKLQLLFTMNTLGINEAKIMALEVLDTMALSGLYDQVEGGFFRYATDPAWQMPHFEKMLYTNAELLANYLRAYQLSNKALYKSIIKESVAMIESRFAVQNLYYSASDADSGHEEGGYFIYSNPEIKKALLQVPQQNREKVSSAFGLEMLPNFEQNWHISYDQESRLTLSYPFLKALRDIRKPREYPFIDTKINTAWNAMMIETLFKLSTIDTHYLALAKSHLEALLSLHYKKNVLYHQSVLGAEVKQKALLEDYAFLIAALVAGYEASFEERYLNLATQLSRQAKRKFYKNSRWYLSDDGLGIVADFQDKYYTAAKNKLLLSLHHLSAIQSDRELHSLVKKSAKNDSALIDAKPLATPSGILVQLALQKGFVTLKANKKNLLEHRNRIQKANIPFIALHSDESLKGFLACDKNQCFAIKSNIDTILKIIEKR